MLFLLSFASLFAAVIAQSSFSPARPPAIPIAVSNPYMNSWLDVGSDGGDGGTLYGEWLKFWTDQITAWTGFIRVDGETYTWFGAPLGTDQNVNQTSFEYTSTKSLFTFTAGTAVGMNVTFLSPVTPTDLERQSIAATYMNVDVFSIDGNEHEVQLYTDVSAEWASGDRTNVVSWDYGVIGGSSSKQKRGSQSSSCTTSVHTTQVEWNSSNGSKSAVIPAATANSALASASVATPVASGYNASSTAKSASNTTAQSSATGTASTGGIAYHRFQRQTQQLFTQVNDQAEWGDWIYATEQVSGLTYSNGASDNETRGAFITNGTLENTKDTDYRAINDEYPVFAFSIDYGKVGSTPESSLFTITLAQEQAIRFESGSGDVQNLPPLWTSSYSDELDLVSFFYNDYTNAQTTASELDSQVTSDSINTGGDDYNIITSLSVRQAFAATQIVGTPENYYLFLKEISSDGDIQTVDVIFPSMPIFLYFNPDLLRLLLDPIFIYTEAGLFGEQYALHDLGFYPNATQAGTEVQQLEESGNMVIMTLAYAQRVGNTSYLSEHYNTLAGWTSFLVNDSLIPMNQISTDDFAGSLANQTNLAIKGIIGIEAMATIANMTGNYADGANYSSIAASYISQWQGLAIAESSSNFSSTPHTTLSYGANDTYGLLYNLYSDALLNTSLVPKSVYQMQSDFYPNVNLEYGVPLDTRHTYTKSDWQLFCAAIAAADTKKMFISDVAKYVQQTPTDRAFSDLYDADTADFGSGPFVARPVVGGHFALLALNGTAPLDG